MNPTFDTGSVVIIKQIKPEDIAVGDIITFKGIRDPKIITTHRVTEVFWDDDELSFTTKGDANNVEDPSRLLPQQVIGKVKFSIPYIGYLLNFASTRLGTYLLVILPLLVIILVEIIKIFRQRSASKEQPETANTTDVTTEETVVVESEIHREDIMEKTTVPIVDPIMGSRIEEMVVKQPPQREFMKEEPNMVKGGPIPGHLDGKAEIPELPETMKQQMTVDKEIVERMRLTRDLQELQDRIAKKRDSIRRLKQTAEGQSVKETDVTDMISEMIGKTQMQWINRVYDYKMQIQQLEADLNKALRNKQEEENKLDNSVYLLREELKSKMGGNNTGRGVATP